MRTCGFDAYLPHKNLEKFGIEACDSIEEVFSQSDFISVHVPLNIHTKNLIHYQVLKTMKPTAYLVKTSRGGVVNEEDLFKALKEKIIAGAAVDVFELEPPSLSHPYFTLDNILVTPHMAAITDGALVRMAQDVAEKVVSILRGNRSVILVNPRVLKK